LLALVVNLLGSLAARAQNGNTNIWFGPGAGLNNWSIAGNWTNATTGTSQRQRMAQGLREGVATTPH
jgi:hypothetical protein